MAKSHHTFKSKKAAREAGLRNKRELLRNWLAPREDAVPLLIKGEEFYAQADCERVLTETTAKRERLSVPTSLSPYAVKPVRIKSIWLQCYVYRESSLVPRRARREIPPAAIDLLQAIYVVNCHAKRCRDAARRSYEAGCYSFATNWSERKVFAYSLKDRGIAHAHTLGRLQ
jgi:hypothetical protein